MIDEEIVKFNQKRGQCPCGKVCFSKKAAQSKRNFLHKIGNERFLRIYQCHMSDWWHLTKTRRNERDY